MERNKKICYSSKKNEKINNLFNSILKSKNGSRKRASIFMNLPNKKEYPDYYTAIKNPISLNCMKNKMKSSNNSLDQNYDYSFDDFVDDLNLMFENAMCYNMEGSVVYEDALYLKSFVERFCDEN